MTLKKSSRVQGLQAAKCQSLVHKYGEGNKPQGANAIDGDNEDALFEAGEVGDTLKNCLVVFIHTPRFTCQRRKPKVFTMGRRSIAE